MSEKGKGRARATGPGKKGRLRWGFPVMLLIWAAILCGGTLGDRGAWGKVYIDIDSPSFQKIPIALADFTPLSGNSGHQELAAWFPGALGKALDLTGYFKILERRNNPSGSAAGQGGFAPWVNIGAEYLISGGFSFQGGRLLGEFRLYDVVQGRPLIGKQYTGKLEDRSDMVLSFVREVLQLLTGAEGFFDTRVAFVCRQGRSSSLYTMGFGGQAESGGLNRVTAAPAPILAPRWSPDGRFLAFASYRDGKPDVYVASPSGGGVKKVVSFKGLNLPGAWSPDGKRLLLTLSKDGNEEIYVMDAASASLRRLTHHSAIDVSPVWSPDGRKIAYVSNRSGSPQVYVMNAEGGESRRLTYSGNYNTSPAWSPRGGKIAYEGRAGSGYQIFTVDEGGGSVRQLTSGAGDHESPSWSPDGRFLAYSVRSGGRSRINIVNVNTLEVRTLYESADRCLSPSWSSRLKSALK